MSFYVGVLPALAVIEGLGMRLAVMYTFCVPSLFHWVESMGMRLMLSTWLHQYCTVAHKIRYYWLKCGSELEPTSYMYSCGEIPIALRLNFWGRAELVYQALSHPPERFLSLYWRVRDGVWLDRPGLSAPRREINLRCEYVGLKPRTFRSTVQCFYH